MYCVLQGMLGPSYIIVESIDNRNTTDPFIAPVLGYNKNEVTQKLPKLRKQKRFVPEENKDEAYWEKVGVDLNFDL